MHPASEALQVTGGMLALAIDREPIAGGGRIRTMPGPLIADIGPDPRRPGAPAAVAAGTRSPDSVAPALRRPPDCLVVAVPRIGPWPLPRYPRAARCGCSPRPCCACA